MSSDPKPAEEKTSGSTPDKTASGFGPKASPQDKNLPGNSQENLSRKLDEAVEETFPSSDPVSVKITK
jgi:hypothetical protein